MPFDSNGTYSRVRSWASDAAAGIKIKSDLHDTHDGDIATALSNCITKDGRTQPLANLPMNGQKIINHGSTLPSDPPNTVVTKDYVDSFRTYTTGLTISGANNPNGYLTFSSPTGVTGLQFSNTGLSWTSKPAEALKYPHRLVYTGWGGLGTELVVLDQNGFIGFQGWFLNNLSYVGDGPWRTNDAGIGTAMNMSGGKVDFHSNRIASVQANQIIDLQPFFSVEHESLKHIGAGNSTLQLQKKASGNISRIYGTNGGSSRWAMDLGSADAESGSYVGSSFLLYAYDNNGVNPKPMFSIDRSSDAAQFYGDIYSSTGRFLGSGNQAILAANVGMIVFRPNGLDSGAGQVYVTEIGDLHLASGSLYVDANTSAGSYLGLGQQGRNGIAGAYTGHWHNWVYSGGELYALIDNTNIGMVSTPCDYRTKRNIKPLGSTWDAVKALRPITYMRRGFKDLFPDDDDIHWGFVAHELQAVLTPDAARGEKDNPDQLQVPNLLAIVAGLTKALQEAMGRIEALEGKAPA